MRAASPDPSRMEYRQVADARYTDAAGNYRIVLQQRVKGMPEMPWEDVSFSYDPGHQPGSSPHG